MAETTFFYKPFPLLRTYTALATLLVAGCIAALSIWFCVSHAGLPVTFDAYGFTGFITLALAFAFMKIAADELGETRNEVSHDEQGWWIRRGFETRSDIVSFPSIPLRRWVIRWARFSLFAGFMTPLVFWIVLLAHLP